MKHLFTKIFLFHLLLIGAVQVTAQNKKSGNPILPGFHADPEVLYSLGTKLLQKSEMRKNMVMDLIYRGFINAANYSESHYNPRRSQIKTELRYLFVTTPNR